MSEKPGAISMPVVILAGGLATRLRPITEKIPKALVTVAGRPFLECQIDLLKRNAVAEVIICVGYRGHLIQERFGDGTAFGIQIRYSSDSPKLLGTGGAIKKALTLLPEAFFVLYGDSYLPVDFQAVARAFRSAGKPALMTVFANADAGEKSNVWFERDDIRLYSKRAKLPAMRHVDYGLMICTKQMFDNSPVGIAFDLAGVLEDLSRRGELAAYEVKERFYEMGSFSGLDDLDRLLTNRSKAK